jgi:hypothetical protein
MTGEVDGLRPQVEPDEVAPFGLPAQKRDRVRGRTAQFPQREICVAPGHARFYLSRSRSRSAATTVRLSKGHLEADPRGAGRARTLKPRILEVIAQHLVRFSEQTERAVLGIEHVRDAANELQPGIQPP